MNNWIPNENEILDFFCLIDCSVINSTSIKPDNDFSFWYLLNLRPMFIFKLVKILLFF